MARSRKHLPITGITTARSEKRDKRLANRSLRAAEREAIHVGADLLPTLRDVSDVWGFAKDGKTYHRPERLSVHPKLMRK